MPVPRGPKPSPTGACERPREAQDRARRRPRSAAGRRAGHAVGAEPRPRLEALERGLAARAEPPSNAPDGKPCVASSNCSAATSQPLSFARDRARAEGGPAAPAERAARARAHDAVDGEPAAGLQAAHGLPCPRAADAVDRAA